MSIKELNLITEMFLTLPGNARKTPLADPKYTYENSVLEEMFMKVASRALWRQISRIASGLKSSGLPGG